MGYALFTARKLSLTSRVNQLNAQLMQVSQQQMNLANTYSAQQMIGSMNQSTSISDAASLFQNGEISSDMYRAKVEQANADATKENAQLSAIASQQNALDLQRETLETQLTAASKELESVEKAEQDAIKNATPSYVG